MSDSSLYKILTVWLICNTFFSAILFNNISHADIDVSCAYQVQQDPVSPCQGVVGKCPDCRTQNGVHTFTTYSGAATHSANNEGSDGIESGFIDCWGTVPCTQSEPQLYHECRTVVLLFNCTPTDESLFCRDWAAENFVWNQKIDYALIPCLAM